MERNLPRKIESVAARVRETLGIENVKAPCLATLLEDGKLASIFPEFQFERVIGDSWSEGIEAEADIDNCTLRISEKTWQELKNGNPRARFTIAHEIGHFALAHRGIRQRNLDANNLTAQRKQWEKEANQFAAFFLAPTNLADDCDSPSDIANEFRLSNQASEARFKELESDRRRKRGIKRPLPDVVIDFMREQELRGSHKFSSIEDKDRDW